MDLEKNMSNHKVKRKEDKECNQLLKKIKVKIISLTNFNLKITLLRIVFSRILQLTSVKINKNLFNCKNNLDLIIIRKTLINFLKLNLLQQINQYKKYKKNNGNKCNQFYQLNKFQGQIDQD